MNNVKLRILPPWSIFIKKIEALFDGDPQIACNVNWDGINPSIVLATNNPDKAAALLKLLPEEKVFGNVTLKIGVDAPTISNNAFADPKELFETAFSGNPAFKYVVTVEDYWYINFTYVVFSREVVSIEADNLKDPRGLINTLYQDIAAEIFTDVDGLIAYSTDVDSKVLSKDQKWMFDIAKKEF